MFGGSLLTLRLLTAELMVVFKLFAISYDHKVILYIII